MKITSEKSQNVFKYQKQQKQEGLNPIVAKQDMKD